MTTPEHKCPKCQHEMEEGFIADVTYGGVVTSKWVEGEPEKSFWTGTKTRGKRQVEILTFRCSNCGYLESYAK
jgi:predicted nucleic-acid-binding Zn-ribbon protein